LPDKGSAIGLDDPQYFVEAVGLVGFPYFVDEAGLVVLQYFAKAAEHFHLELVGY
jgi:hypothetical protein